MSNWQREHEAFIWTVIDEQAYRLLLFNHSPKGIFIVQPNGEHLSIHTDGYSCNRLTEAQKEEGIPEIPFRLPPIKDTRAHLALSIYTPMYRDYVTRTAKKIPSPNRESGSIFLDMSRFPVGTKMVVETFFYAPHVSAEMPRIIAVRPFEQLAFKEYPLEKHSKLLGVVVYRKTC